MFSLLRNRLKNLTKRIPQIVAITKENAPNAKIFTESPVRNSVACVEAPTVTPSNMVTISMSGPLAVSASLLVTPLSLSKFPKKSIPRRGRAEGTSVQVNKSPTIGKIIFSICATARGRFILITRSFLDVSNLMKGG